MSEAQENTKRFLLRMLMGALLVILGVLAATLIAGHFRFYYHMWEDSFVGSLLVVASYLGLSVVAAGLMCQGRNDKAMMVGIGMSFAAMFLAIVFINTEYGTNWEAGDRIARMTASLTVLVLVILYDGILRLMETDSVSILLARFFVLLGAWLLAGLMIFIFWFQEISGMSSSPLFLAIVMTTYSMLLVWTVVGPLIVRHLYVREKTKFSREATTILKDTPIEFDCPNCGEFLSAPCGTGRCESCHFTMKLSIEEPRCECGYLIFRDHAELCPECGLAITPEDRWVIQDAPTPSLAT